MASTASSKTSAENVTFEQALKELEATVRKLEGGNVELEQAIEDYTRGMQLKEICEKKLNEAKLKVERVIASSNGVKTEPFSTEAS
jgi:exodeoxyribonuclease VII small subunit